MKPLPNPHTARRRYLLGLVGLMLLALGASFMWSRSPRHDGLGSALYCATFTHPSKAVGMVRAAIEGRPTRPSLGLPDLRPLRDVLFGDAVASGAPSNYRSDARTVLTALRAAIRLGSEAPLDTHATRLAVRHLEDKSLQICPAT